MNYCYPFNTFSLYTICIRNMDPVVKTNKRVSYKHGFGFTSADD
jgi:hypothetical protein